MAAKFGKALEETTKRRFGQSRGELFKQSMGDSLMDLLSGGASAPARISKAGMNKGLVKALFKAYKELMQHTRKGSTWETIGGTMTPRNTLQYTGKMGKGLAQAIEQQSRLPQISRQGIKKVKYDPVKSLSERRAYFNHADNSMGLTVEGMRPESIFHEETHGLQKLLYDHWLKANPQRTSTKHMFGQQISQRRRGAEALLRKLKEQGSSLGIHDLTPGEMQAKSFAQGIEAFLKKNPNRKLSTEEFMNAFMNKGTESLRKAKTATDAAIQQYGLNPKLFPELK